MKPANSKTNRCAGTFHGLCFATLMLALPVQAQYVPETVPRAGEQRLNRFQYHATHNSFERDNGSLDRVSIADQLDKYGTWMIEFDLSARLDSGRYDLYVFHDCDDPAGEGWLDDYLAEVDATQRSTTGLTFIYFDDKNNGPCIFHPSIGPLPSDWHTTLINKCEARWGNRVYAHNEFIHVDDQKWPSTQELLRRGKNFVLIINGNKASDPNTRLGDYLFAINNNQANPSYSSVFWLNEDKEDTTFTAADLGDRYFARHYPSGGWTCFGGAGDTGWAWAVNNNYTFTASNCSDRLPNAGNHFHPPLPTYVCCPTGSGGGRGTFTHAYNGPSGVVDAVAMVQSAQNGKGASVIPIRINTGTYTAPTRIAATLKLIAVGGTVRLQ